MRRNQDRKSFGTRYPDRIMWATAVTRQAPDGPAHPPGSSEIIANFAALLRGLREKSGNPSYRDMGKIAHYSYATLSRAAAGKTFPTKEATLAFVKGCGAPDGVWATLYDESRAALASAQAEEQKPSEPHDAEAPVRAPTPTERPSALGPEHVSSPREFAEAMRGIKQSFPLSYRQISELTKLVTPRSGPDQVGAGIPSSTLSDLCNPDLGRLPEAATVRAFLRALRTPANTSDRWMRAYARLRRERDHERRSSRLDALQRSREPAGPPRGLTLRWAAQTAAGGAIAAVTAHLIDTLITALT